MKRALALAQEAFDVDETPVGCIVVDSSHNIIAESHNLRESLQRSTAHAEVLAIENACKILNNWRLLNCTLYVTLEPCFMCAGAIILSRIPRIVFAAFDPKAGAVGSLANVLNDNRLNHKCDVISGLCAEESSELLKKFFKLRRLG